MFSVIVVQSFFNALNGASNLSIKYYYDYIASVETKQNDAFTGKDENNKKTRSTYFSPPGQKISAPFEQILYFLVSNH